MSLEKQLLKKSLEADDVIRDLEQKNEQNTANLEEKDSILKHTFSEVIFFIKINLYFYFKSCFLLILKLRILFDRSILG